MLGIEILQAVPAVSGSDLEKITIGKLVRVSNKDLGKEEMKRIKARINHLNALGASILEIE